MLHQAGGVRKETESAVLSEERAQRDFALGLGGGGKMRCGSLEAVPMAVMTWEEGSASLNDKQWV